MGGSWEHAVGKARDRALGWVEKEPTQENEDGACREAVGNSGES